MKKPNSKITTIALILALTTFATLATLPFTGAQEPIRKASYAVIGAVPNPVGVNQQTLLWIGITDSVAHPKPGWYNLTVLVTKPDGSTDTLGPYTTDTTGSTGKLFTPTMVGTYILQTHFPEQVSETASRGLPAGTIYEESTSEEYELVVTEERVEYYPGHSLPSEYWTRPIDAQLREWYTISGNWLGGVGSPTNKFQPYSSVPDAPHILWTKPLAMGGLAGGLTGEHAFECGDAYEGLFGNPVILGGVLFYNEFKSNGGNNVEQTVVAVDLHTGEEMWNKPLVDGEGVVQRLSFGQVFYWDSYNYHAVFDYLWATSGSTWHAFDAYSGRWEYSMTNVPSGKHVYGDKGEIFIYTVNSAAGWMTMWNSSRVVSNAGSWGSATLGRTFNATNGLDWNVTIPQGLPQSSLARIFLSDRVMDTNTDWMQFTAYPIRIWAISTAPGSEGHLLFDVTWTPPQPDLSIGVAAVSEDDGVLVLAAKETRQFYGFSIDTGALLWGPTEPKPTIDMFDILASSYDTFVHSSQVIAYGKLFSGGTGGVAAAYDITNGNLLWTYDVVDTYSEILWGNNWPLRVSIVADEKVILSHQEHSVIDPKPRGAPLVCLDANTGHLIWNITIRGTWWGGPPILGDSIIASMNTYDQQVYAVGKGPTETTVTASPIVSTHGSSVMLQGKVIDTSPGTTDYDKQVRFPNGVPAVSDASMNEWMQYVYMQFERPTDAVGVTVKLEAVDPSGSYKYLGTTITDSYGNYGFAFEPEDEGKYMIIASFEGSGGYYGSTATTYLTVDPAPSPSEPIEPEEPTHGLISAELAIILVLVAAVAIIVAVWALKKRK